MRDHKRISRILKLLEEYWEKNPDFRLGQIIVNLTPNNTYRDLFYVEDEDWERVLMEEINCP